MKISRKQLRRLIKESMQDYPVREGFFGDAFDAVKSAVKGAGDKISFGQYEEDMIKVSSRDAFELFKAMQGLGTDEDKVVEIIKKRADNLDVLYDEYNALLDSFNNTSQLYKVFDHLFGTGVIKSETWDGDLIEWLSGDGMDEEAQTVEEFLKSKNKSRVLIDIKPK